MTGAAEGLGYASWVVATCGFSISGVCGLNLALIASDSWDFLSRLLFYETQVESFRPVARDRLVGVFHHAIHRARQRRALHF